MAQSRYGLTSIAPPQALKLTTSILPVIACLVHPVGQAAQITFDLHTPTDAVAVQFDVVPAGSGLIDLKSPQLEVSSPHAVVSNRLSSGAVRHVIYSTEGLPIGAAGKLQVTFESNLPMAGGVFSVTGVIASNASGQLTGGSSNVPNALPVLTVPTGGYRSAEVGLVTELVAAVVDPDGSLTSVNHRLNGQSKGAAVSSPWSVPWTPDISGLFAWSALATDSRGGAASLDLGSILAYQASDVSSFAAWSQIRYGSAVDPAWYGFDADPLRIGIDNGIAYLLGLDPHNPDRSRLPSGTIETHNGQPHFTFRFVRANPPGVSWSIRESTFLSTWTSVPGAQITQNALGGGLTEVLVRRPLSAAPGGKLFMQLEAKE